MKNRETLMKIYYEIRNLDRSIMRLSNIGLIGLLSGLASRAKKTAANVKKTIIKGGLVLTIVCEILIMISNIADHRMYEEDMKEENFQ